MGFELNKGKKFNSYGENLLSVCLPVAYKLLKLDVRAYTGR